MKRLLLNKWSIITVTVLLIGCSCKKSTRDINLNLTAVPSLFSPADGKSIVLKPSANLTESFEWEQAKAEDGALVLYEVAFDRENGDFSNPFYVVVSNNKGVDNKLTLSHGDLNKIAALGGAEFFQTKKFRWTVLASKGTNIKKAAASRLIQLQRPGGFAVLPGNIYLTGSATEGGATLANALQMKQLSPGVFEIYSRLTAGTYQFVDGTTGTPKQYYLFDDNGSLVIGVNGQTTYSGADKIMRIRLDFNNINGNLVEVKSMALWYCQGNAFWFTLPYTSNGVWRKNGYTVNLGSVPWGLEDRYKYKMVLNDGTGDKDQWLNYSSGDSPGQDGQYPHTVLYKTINLDANNASQWDWSWKFDKKYLTQGSVADFWVSLRGSDPAYTENYQKQ